MKRKITTSELKPLHLILCVLLILSVFAACSADKSVDLVSEYQVKFNDSVVKIKETKLINDGKLAFEEKNTVKLEGGLYAEYSTLQEAYSNADCVIYGKVKEIKDGIMQERRDENFDEDGNSIVYYFTPIVIEVIACYKGDETAETVTYYSLGAEDSENVYIYDAYDTFGIQVGDEMVVFLNDKKFGFFESIAPRNVYIGKDASKSITEELAEFVG